MSQRTRGLIVRPARSGFTLVELLVVISIIGMLAALLLPAVNQARESGRRAVCLNNEKQIGLALVGYEQRHGSFPGYCNAQAIDPSTGNATRPVGWMFAILPFLERNDLIEGYGTAAFKQSGGVTVPSASPPPPLTFPNPYFPPNVFLKIAVCPSDARAEVINAASEYENQSANSYVANCGMKDVVGTPYNLAARDSAANGVFHFNYPYGNLTVTESASNEFGVPATTNGVKTGEQIVKVSTSSITDGTATTLLISENCDSGNWTNCWESRVGFVWQAGLDANGVPAPMPSNVSGSSTDNLPTNISTPVGYEGLLTINEKFGEFDNAPQSPGDGRLMFARPSSFHPGGVNATFCEGHVQFLADTIEYLVYCQLMTPRGRAAATAPTTSVGVMPLDADTTYQAYTRKTLNEGGY